MDPHLVAHLSITLQDYVQGLREEIFKTYSMYGTAYSIRGEACAGGQMPAG